MPQKTLHWFMINLLAAYIPSLLALALALQPTTPRPYFFAPIILPILSLSLTNPMFCAALLGAFMAGVAFLSFCFRSPGGRAVVLAGLLVISFVQAMWVAFVVHLLHGLAHS